MSELESVRQSFERLNKEGWPCAYYGERGDWLQVLGRHRDSDLLSQSNFDCAYAMLTAINEDGVAIESASHWAVGWVETILIDPACAALVKEAESIQAALADYPVLDESDYCEREWNAVCEYWERADLRERVELCRKHDVSIFAARRDELPESDYLQERIRCYVNE